MKIEDFFLVIILTILVLFGAYTVVNGKSSTSFRPPTTQELITSMRVNILGEFSQLLIRTNTLAKIELATQLPCAGVRVSSDTSNGRIFYGLETNFDDCKEKKEIK